MFTLGIGVTNGVSSKAAVGQLTGSYANKCVRAVLKNTSGTTRASSLTLWSSNAFYQRTGVIKGASGQLANNATLTQEQAQCPYSYVIAVGSIHKTANMNSVIEYQKEIHLESKVK